MRRIAAMLGRHLFLRVYLYQVLIILALVATTLVFKRMVLEPHAELAQGGMRYLGEWALRESDQPERLQRELGALRERIGLSLAMYSRGGRLIVQDGARPEPELDTETLARLERSGWLELAPHRTAVGLRDPSGSLLAYAIVSLPVGAWPPGGRVPFAVALILVGFALGSVPIARSISRPLSQLSRAASAFGAGDLSSRARLTRSDELGDLSRAFDQMADRIEVLRRSERELLASVSHELRTPLARIRVVLELAAEEFPDAASRYTTEIASDLNELETLLDDIIRAARLDSTAQASRPYPPLSRAPLGVEGFVKSIVRRFTELHPDRPLTHQITCDAELSLLADKMLLKRALENVLENAHKYSLPNRAIEVRAEQASGSSSVSIIVQDDGVGIDAADLPHVFTPFFRGDRSRARKTGGTGLGLTLAQRIVEAHGGTIRLQSQPEHGTIVTISLPLGAAVETPSL
jgi:signal transduction histidine kinase